MNKKERRKALFCVLSAKLKNNEIVIVDEIKLKEMKSKLMMDILTKLPIEGTALLALGKKDKNVEKSAANLPKVKSIDVGYLNIQDLLKYKVLVLPQDALERVHALAK